MEHILDHYRKTYIPPTKRATFTLGEDVYKVDTYTLAALSTLYRSIPPGEHIFELNLRNTIHHYSELSLLLDLVEGRPEGERLIIDIEYGVDDRSPLVYYRVLELCEFLGIEYTNSLSTIDIDNTPLVFLEIANKLGNKKLYHMVVR